MSVGMVCRTEDIGTSTDHTRTFTMVARSDVEIEHLLIEKKLNMINRVMGK